MGMTQDELKAMQADNLDDIVPLLDEMSGDDLAALLALEQADKHPRVGLVNPIEELLASRVQAAPPAAAAKAERAEVPDWKKPDYTGPLTADQAYWRNTHLVTKAADAVKAK